jgi:hypothetical protein
VIRFLRSVFMGSNMQTGLLLVLGIIVSIIGWFGFYPADGTASATEQATDIMANADRAKIGIILGYGGMGAAFIGIFNIARGMAAAGGKGASYGNVVFILTVALLAGMIATAGLELGTAEATSAQGGVTLMGVAMAFGGSFQIVMGLTLALLGIGIVLDKNFHIVVGAMAVVAGVLMLVGSLVEVEGLDIGGWVLWMLTALALGGLTLKAKA